MDYQNTPIIYQILEPQSAHPWARCKTWIYTFTLRTSSLALSQQLDLLGTERVHLLTINTWKVLGWLGRVWAGKWCVRVFFFLLRAPSHFYGATQSTHCGCQAGCRAVEVWCKSLQSGAAENNFDRLGGEEEGERGGGGGSAILRGFFFSFPLTVHFWSKLYHPAFTVSFLNGCITYCQLPVV